MAGLRDILATDLAAALFDTAAADTPAATVTYTPSGGDGSDLTAIFSEIEPARPQAVVDGESAIRAATCRITAAALTAASITPAAGDSITRSSVDWTVQAVRHIPGAVWEIQLHRTERREKSRQAYRIRQ